MTKSLHYFMRDIAKEEQIISLRGPESFKNEKGETLNFEIKKLSRKSIQDILERYKSQEILYDANRNPYVIDGEAVFKTKTDHARAIRHIIVEALQYPNLKDPSLLEFFNCIDITEMPLCVFPNSEEYAYVLEMVMGVLGLKSPSNELEKEVGDAKN